MKLKLSLLLTVCFGFAAMCCFMQDPHQWLSTIVINPTTNVEVEFDVIPRPADYPTWVKPKDWPVTSRTGLTPDVYQSFPITFQMEFTGFENGGTVSRMCLMYYNRSGKWTIIKDVQNPNFTVESNTGNKRAMFGKYVIESAYGYKTGDIIPTIAYFKSSNGEETHNLARLLDGTLKWDAEGVLYIGVISNTKPR